MIYWDRHELHQIIRQIPNSNSFNLTEKIALLLVSKETENQRADLFQKMHKFVLLRNRCHTISERFNSTKSVLSVLRQHEEKVSWQLRRIYRTRNMIVHTSYKPPYTNILIENAHSYLDLIVSNLLELASAKNLIDSIDQAVELVKMKVKSHEDYLKASAELCDRNNFTKILFGYFK